MIGVMGARWIANRLAFLKKLEKERRHERSAPTPRNCGNRNQTAHGAYGDILSDLRADADAVYTARRRGVPRGPISGLKPLDDELSCAFANDLHIMHSDAGTGKTALALQIASSCRCPALFVTCELAPTELLLRHMARVTETFLGRFKSGVMRGEQVESLALCAIEAAPDLYLIDATRAAADLKYLRECTEAVRGSSPHLLLVIDSLHTWTQSNSAISGASEYEALNAALRGLQQMAAHLECPILMTSERNHGGVRSGGSNVRAGTRKIEYQGETVINLDRTEGAPPDGRGEVEVTLSLAKNRHGAVGKKIPLLFNAGLQRFKEAEVEECA